MNTKRIRECLKDKENLAFTIWFLWMAVYYGYRMFALTPWYDELYTYYYFISRGPVYAAIHWPLPNNHVGYSVLSGFLDWFGNSMIGLRGISYICALLNLGLLYRIGRRHLAKGWAFAAVVLYCGMNLVNQLAVQGRGYTLAVSCYLTAVCMLQQLGGISHKKHTVAAPDSDSDKDLNKDKETKKDIKYYVLFSLSLTLGLYVLPSSVYWVLPVCMAGGLYLLVYQKYRRLVHLIISSAIAAVHTLILYAVIWLAIGSNLLSKNESSEWFGRGHVSIILSAPFQAMRTGIDYMLATPYIQSVEREGYLQAFADWLQSLLNYFYSGMGLWLAVLIVMAGAVVALRGIRRDARQTSVFFAIYLLSFIILTPVILIIQCKLPYFRVFSYMGTVIALLAAAFLQKAAEWATAKKTSVHMEWISGGVTALFTLLVIVLLVSKDYNNQYGTAEYYAEDALRQTAAEEKENLCVTDCFQQYLLKFCYGIECESTQIEAADLVLLHKQMADAGYEGFRWEFYHTYDTIPWDYVKQELTQVYENEEYIVYEKIKQ